jgi:hypothetical protein
MDNENEILDSIRREIILMWNMQLNEQKEEKLKMLKYSFGPPILQNTQFWSPYFSL